MSAAWTVTPIAVSAVGGVLAQSAGASDLFLQYGALGLLGVCMVLLIRGVIGKLDSIAERLILYAEQATKSAASASDLAIAIDELRIATVADRAANQTMVNLIDRMQKKAEEDAQTVHRRQEDILKLLRAASRRKS